MREHTPGPYEIDDSGYFLHIVKRSKQSRDSGSPDVLECLATLEKRIGIGDNARLFAAAPEMHELWRKHEWSAWNVSHAVGMEWCCPECRNLKRDGHADDCELAACLKKAGKL